jgi:uncharacterized protein YoxC
MDPVPIAITIAILVLTGVFSILSIQVWYILGEFRTSLTKVNKILDDTGEVTETVSEGVQSLSGVIEGVKSVSSMVSAFRRKGVSHE